jgi:hypothetical protein
MTRTLTLAGYIVIVLAIVANEVAARRRDDAATLADAVAAFARTRIGKWVMLAGWLWLGWHLFVRTGHG